MAPIARTHTHTHTHTCTRHKQGIRQRHLHPPPTYTCIYTYTHIHIYRLYAVYSICDDKCSFTCGCTHVYGICDMRSICIVYSVYGAYVYMCIWVYIVYMSTCYMLHSTSTYCISLYCSLMYMCISHALTFYHPLYLPADIE